MPLKESVGCKMTPRANNKTQYSAELTHRRSKEMYIITPTCITPIGACLLIRSERAAPLIYSERRDGEKKVAQTRHTHREHLSFFFLFN
jgi:hypothetical protein